jgi:endonuclease YncB( thermonuclease family)
MGSLLLILFAPLPAGQVNAATFTGRVVGTHDGDTIIALDAGHRQQKIRLAGR